LGQFTQWDGQPRALEGKEAEGVKLVQRGEETYLVRQQVASK